jgi:hypothetical protein
MNIRPIATGYSSSKLLEGKIKGQHSSSTDINRNIWHLPGVSRALQLDLHIEMKEDIVQEASARNSEGYMNLTIGRLAAFEIENKTSPSAGFFPFRETNDRLSLSP